MTQEERWTIRYNEVMEFLEREHRNPSKYNLEHRDMYNWLKANRKQLNAGKMKEERMKLFEGLMELCEEYHHINQYV